MPRKIHLSFVKEKQCYIKNKTNIYLSIQHPYYAILFWLSGYQFKKVSLTKILAIGNYFLEIFGCPIEAKIPWEIITCSKMSFRFREIIGVLI